MSVTGHNLPGKERHVTDWYATPPWCVESLYQNVSLPVPTLDPCAGDAAILRTIDELLPDNNMTGIELVPEIRDSHEDPHPRVIVGDGLAVDWRGQHVLTNPPFKLAEDFVRKGIEEAETAVFLLRLGFMGSESRFPLWSEHPPDGICVLPNRPSFKHGTTDSAYYAWYVWLRGSQSPAPTLTWLPLVSRERRQRRT